MAAVPDHNVYFPSASAAYGDSTFTCPGNTMAEMMSAFFAPDQVWNYRYNVIDPDNIAAGVGVPHTFETSAIFGPGFVGSSADSFFSTDSYFSTNAEIVPVTMMYFISFVTALDPNIHRSIDAPVWENWGSFGADKRLRLKLETNATFMEEVPDFLTTRCALWKDLSTAMEI